jgi:hypothetical protein
MRLLLFATLLVVIFVCVPRALAVCDGCADPANADMVSVCNPAMSADDCMWAPMGAMGGDYAECSAWANLDQQCVTRVFSWEQRTNVCAKVLYSAHCKCDSFGAYGTCKYRA